MTAHFPFPWFSKAHYLQLKAMNRSHQEGAKRSVICRTEKPVPPSQTSCSNLKQASSEKGDWAPGNATADMKRIPPGLRERRPIQQVFYLSQISDTYLEVYNREELSKVRLSQTSFLSCALKIVKPLIYLTKYKILSFPSKRGREKNTTDQGSLYFLLNHALVLPSTEV